MIRMSDDEGCTEEHQQRFVKVDSLAGEVLVRDDTGDLEEMEEMANRLLDEAEQRHHRIQDQTNPGGMHQ